MCKYLAILVLASSGCASVPSGTAIVDIATLVGEPAAYDDKIVQIRGASVARFEAEFVCPGLAQIDSGRSKECLWLLPGVGEGLAPRQLAGFHKRWVVIVGRYNANNTGHGGAYGGAIVPLTYKVVGTHASGDIPSVADPSAN